LTAHSAEDLARLSTLVHNLLGIVLLALAAVLVAELLRGVPEGRARFAWPAIGAVLGFGLATWVFFHQIFSHGLGPFDDPAQNQHQAIGLLAGLGSAGEIARRAGGPDALKVGFPLGLVGVGVAFVAHEQHALEALIVHWALAATLITSGLATLSAVISGEEARAMRLFGAFALIAAAAQLVVYEEEPGAHGSTGSDAHAGH
jgi:hypothetical protein